MHKQVSEIGSRKKRLLLWVLSPAYLLSLLVRHLKGLNHFLLSKLEERNKTRQSKISRHENYSNIATAQPVTTVAPILLVTVAVQVVLLLTVIAVVQAALVLMSLSILIVRDSSPAVVLTFHHEIISLLPAIRTYRAVKVLSIIVE
jgi:hypothetical protein